MMEIITSFEDRYIIDPNSGCWIWIGTWDRKMYGRMWMGKGFPLKFAHRISYEIHKGAIPTGMFVCHHCDTPPCVNPDHLFLGDNSANMSDKAMKGRAPHGSQHHFSKLTESDVIAIRADTRIMQDIADDYGITLGNVSHIKRRHTWKRI